MAEKRNPYDNVKRPTVQFSPEEHRRILHYCIDQEIKIGDFLRQAAIYCMKHKINPAEDK
jgi:hypothetical protein